MDEFNAEELLSRVKAEIMANDLDATEEQADKTARQFIENIVKAAASGDGGVIGIGGNVFTYNGNGVTSVSPESTSSAKHSRIAETVKRLPLLLRTISTSAAGRSFRPKHRKSSKKSSPRSTS